MSIIKINSRPDGSRPGLQSWDKKKPLLKGFAICPDEFVDVFYSTTPAGFVNITVEGNTVVEMSINYEALNAYTEAHPAQEKEEVLAQDTNAELYDELAKAFSEGVNSID